MWFQPLFFRLDQFTWLWTACGLWCSASGNVTHSSTKRPSRCYLCVHLCFLARSLSSTQAWRWAWWIALPLQVKGYTGADNLGAALYGCDLVLIPAGVPRKPGMTRDDLFNINAGTPHLQLCSFQRVHHWTHAVWPPFGVGGEGCFFEMMSISSCLLMMWSWSSD